MKKILFALFDRRETLNEAIEELEAAGVPRERLQLFTHQDKVEETDLNFRESDALGGLRRGALIGCVLGLVFGFVAASNNWIDVGPWTAALFAGLMFAIFGALGGAISGAAAPHEDMEDMTEEMQEGQVLVSAEVNDVETEFIVEDIFRRHGALQTSGANRAPVAS